MKEERLNSKWIDVLWGVLFVVFVLLTLVVYIQSDVWSVQVLSACLGAIITIIATRLLLTAQSRIEKERRDDEERAKREFEIYTSKLKVYSDFVSSMYTILSDNKITEDEMLGLRTKLFGQVSFYASEDVMKDINKQLSTIRYFSNIEKVQPAFANIAKRLQEDLQKSPVKENTINELWGTFEELFANDNTTADRESSTETTPIKEAGITKSMATAGGHSLLSNTFWHFAILNADEQIKALRDKKYELCLIEYGEVWRTNLLKQVKENDLVFLFRSGGWGYMGVYRVKGWRVLEFDDGTIIKETVMLGNEERIITDAATLKEDTEQYDIYKSLEDDATLCSSIIVEPLAFAAYGIGNPGSVYRRTISRYDHDYGLKQLARFMAIKDDANNYNVHFNGKTTVEMGCNKALFEQMLEEGGIKPAARDENGNWL